MAWDDTQTSSDEITYTEWNDMVAYIKSVISATDTVSIAQDNFVYAGSAITATPTELNKLDGVTATTGELNYVDVTTLGSVEASKAVTADSNKEIFIEETGKIKLHGTEPTSNQTGNGIIVGDINAGDTIAIGEVVYYSAADSEWMKTDANAELTSKGMLGIALEAKSNGQAMKVLLKGFYRDDSAFSFTAGNTLYLSGTAGDLTATAPSATGDIIRVAGYAITDDLIYFNPSSTWIEHT